MFGFAGMLREMQEPSQKEQTADWSAIASVAALSPLALTATDEQRAAAKDAYDYLAMSDKIKGDYQIVDGKTKGPRKANQVTQEEFQKIAHTLTDIDKGKSDLDITKGERMPGAMPVPEKDSWVAGMTPAEAHERNEAIAAKSEAMDAADKEGKLDDVRKMMQTGAGRELVYKLSNNVNKGTHEHVKTTVSNDGMDHAFAASNAEGSERNGMGATASNAYYQAGDDRSLFSALTQSMHLTTGTKQTGKIGDSRADKNVSKDLYGTLREEAAVEGVGGYGTNLNGEKITLNQYDKEQRTNR
jgi:hypothetical protein